MVKVRVSQIPEEDGEPIRVGNSYATGEKPLQAVSTDVKPSGEEEDENGKPQYIKTVISIPDAGIVLSLQDVNSIEKTFKLQSSDYYPDRVTTLYGIVINRAIEPSMRIPKTDIELWYEREEVRDQRYEKMLKALKEAGFKFIEI